MTGVYVIEAPAVNRVKVGWSHDPRLRLIGLQVASPTELVLRYDLEVLRVPPPVVGLRRVTDIARAMYAAPVIEALAHERLREFRWGGEWFEVGWMRAADECSFAALEVLADPAHFVAHFHDPMVAAWMGDDPFEGLE